MFQRKNLQELPNNETEEDVEMTTLKKRYISPEERQQIIDELRLVPKKYVWIKVNIKKKQKQIIYKLRPVL